MSYQFGIGVLYGGPAVSEMEFGCIQGVTLDFSFDKAMLHCGNALYPRDVRIHTASITGRAQFADIDGEAIYKILGGDSYTPGDTTLTLKDDTSPAAFRIRFLTTTDSVSLVFTLNSCQTDSLSWSFARTDYVIPDFSFTAYADTNRTVGTIDLGDAS
jgi:hypothetical protein